MSKFLIETTYSVQYNILSLYDSHIRLVLLFVLLGCKNFLDSIPSDIVFIGPVGSGKSSLIGSLYRAVNEVDRFPDRIHLSLNHPDDDSHGTMHWMETTGNKAGTIVYQDTRGDQVGEGRG